MEYYWKIKSTFLFIFFLTSILLTTAGQGGLNDIKPSESQCRPYIEEALKKFESGGTLEGHQEFIQAAESSDTIINESNEELNTNESNESKDNDATDKDTIETQQNIDISSTENETDIEESLETEEKQLDQTEEIKTTVEGEDLFDEKSEEESEVEIDERKEDTESETKEDVLEEDSVEDEKNIDSNQNVIEDLTESIEEDIKFDSVGRTDEGNSEENDNNKSLGDNCVEEECSNQYESSNLNHKTEDFTEDDKENEESLSQENNSKQEVKISDEESIQDSEVDDQDIEIQTSIDHEDSLELGLEVSNEDIRDRRETSISNEQAEDNESKEDAIKESQEQIQDETDISNEQENVTDKNTDEQVFAYESKEKSAGNEESESVEAEQVKASEEESGQTEEQEQEDIHGENVKDDEHVDVSVEDMLHQNVQADISEEEDQKDASTEYITDKEHVDAEQVTDQETVQNSENQENDEVSEEHSDDEVIQEKESIEQNEVSEEHVDDKVIQEKESIEQDEVSEKHVDDEVISEKESIEQDEVSENHVDDEVIPEKESLEQDEVSEQHVDDEVIPEKESTEQDEVSEQHADDEVIPEKESTEQDEVSEKHVDDEVIQEKESTEQEDSSLPEEQEADKDASTHGSAEEKESITLEEHVAREASEEIIDTEKHEQTSDEDTQEPEDTDANISDTTEITETDQITGTSYTLPEEDLTQGFDIPTNLRSNNYINEVLHLNDVETETEKSVNKAADVILKELKRLYENAIKPLEILYKYRDLSNRHFGDPEIFSKPLVLFMGPWSGGKSSIINYLLDNEYKPTSLRTGAEPSPAYFNILMWGEEPEVVDGTQLAADWTFSGLQKFGQGLEERLNGVKLPSKLLKKVNIVEIPGILEVRKQVSRLFPFNDACQWFIDRADIIFLVYDPFKLDVGPETEAILDQLKGREYQTRILLNKADQVKAEELMRVQGALIWNISPLMASAQPPVMYLTSLWSRAYEEGAPVRLLQAQEKAFLKDIKNAVDRKIENKISSARRFAVRVRNHAKMVDCYLTTYYNHKSVFANKKLVADQIIEHPQDYHIYEGLSTLTNISRYDLPDPDVYRDFFKLNALYEFQQLSATCTYFRGCPINRLDVAIAYDFPELVGKYKKLIEAAQPSIPDSTIKS